MDWTMWQGWRKRRAGVVISGLVLMASGGLGAQFRPWGEWGRVWASAFNQWSAHSVTGVPAAGLATLSLANPEGLTLSGGPTIQPLATNAPLLVDPGPNQEIATPLAVNCPPEGPNCTVTLSLARPHAAGFALRSGTAGLQEALNYLAGKGGVVVLDANWPGTTAMISAAQENAQVRILDERAGSRVWYEWNGTGYAMQPQSLLVASFPGSDLGAQFNAAAAAATPGGTLVLPCGGDQQVATQMVISKPLQVVGCGRGGRLIPTTALAGKPMFYMAEGNGSATFTPWGDAVGMSLENVWIEDTSGRGFQTDGIMMNWVKHAHLRNITVEGLDGYALKLGDPSVNLLNPVSESSFDNLHFFWDGDSTDQLPALDIYTPAGSGDEHNDLYFNDGQITNSYYWAIRIGTGNADLGPRQIYLTNIQVEGREALYSTQGESGNAFPVTIPTPYDGIEIQHAQSVNLNGTQVMNSGQGSSDINIIGSSAYPVGNVSVENGTFGGGTCVTNTVNTNGAEVTLSNGPAFTTDGTWNGLTATVNGTSYTVSSVADANDLALTSSAETQTGVTFQICGGSAHFIQTDYINNLYSSGNYWIGTSGMPWNILHPQSGNYADLPPVAYENLGLAGNYIGAGSDLAIVLQNNAGSGQGWALDSKNDGSFSIFPKTSGATLTLNNALSVGAAQSSLNQPLAVGCTGCQYGKAELTVQGNTTTGEALAFASTGRTWEWAQGGTDCGASDGRVCLYDGSNAQAALTIGPSDVASFLATPTVGATPLTQTVATGSASLNTTAIAAGACASAVVVPAAGVMNSDVVGFSPNAAPAAGTNSLLLVHGYAAAGNVNFLVCNPTAAAITPAPETLNWHVVR